MVLWYISLHQALGIVFENHLNHVCYFAYLLVVLLFDSWTDHFYILSMVFFKPPLFEYIKHVLMSTSLSCFITNGTITTHVFAFSNDSCPGISFSWISNEGIIKSSLSTFNHHELMRIYIGWTYSYGCMRIHIPGFLVLHMWQPLRLFHLRYSGVCYSRRFCTSILMQLSFARPWTTVSPALVALMSLKSDFLIFSADMMEYKQRVQCLSELIVSTRHCNQKRTPRGGLQ